ncbi:MAG TPA: hypothetical protein VIY49_33335 [Bryobacteraceae bacterium]
MRSANDLVSLLAVTAAFAFPIAAQWVKYPTAGVPRGPDGKPNLSAPAPRAEDGHPNLSGLWGAEINVPCPPDGCADLPLNRQFLVIGSRVEGGLPFQPWAAAIHAKRSADNGKRTANVLCALK